MTVESCGRSGLWAGLDSARQRLVAGLVVVLVVVLVAGGGGVARAEQPPAAAVTESELMRIRDRIHASLRDLAVLQGAWVDVTRSDGKIVLTPFLDRDPQRYNEQEKALGGLIKELAGNQQVVLQPAVKRPVSSLLETLKYQILAETLKPGGELMGTRVVGAYYRVNREGGTTELVLRGRVGSERQRDLVRRVCTDLMQKEPYWRVKEKGVSVNLIASYPVTSELRAAPQNRAQGIATKFRGTRQFFRVPFNVAAESAPEGQTQLKSARQLFWTSVVDSPDPLIPYYFLIACELRLKREKQARQLLQWPVRRGIPKMVAFQQVQIAFEKFQGDHRIKLRQLHSDIESKMP
jgi:hypothetical protein